MSLTGIILDVSGSMKESIGSGIDEEGGPWAQSIFNVIDDLIEHDTSSENRVFAIGVGARCAHEANKEIFDVIGSVQQIQNLEIPSYAKNSRATKTHVNKILDILERNGARNIRKWANNITYIQDSATDYMAALILKKLQSDEQFCWEFVNMFLPLSCRDTVEFPVFCLLENFAVSAITSFRTAKREEINEVVEKAKSYFAKALGRQSIFTMQDASRIIRGCVDADEMSKERAQELLGNVEPFIYGRTPLYRSLIEATELFKRETCDTKLLFVLSDGKPTDVSSEDTAKINQVTAELREAGVTVVSCFITRSTDIHPKRLYDEMQRDWETGAKFMFSLSSVVPTQHLPRAILVKRGWEIDITNNETKLFIQANHPDHLREACQMARDVACCPDALADLLVSVDLDVYISQSTSGFKAKKQERGTCYANASAAVLHLAMRRILGREGGYPDFHELRDEMTGEYGMEGAYVSEVLTKMCERYRLHCQKVSLKDAMKAIVKKRPVVATFCLTNEVEWPAFSKFFENNPKGILTRNKIDVRKRPKSPAPEMSGHAVVLTSFNSKCLIFMNSWGQDWGDIGFFRVKDADVLQLEFFDVYWTLDDLTRGEKKYYKTHEPEVARKLMEKFKGLQKADYACPKCGRKSLVTEFTGTLSWVNCPKCSRTFSTKDSAGNMLALNIYLTSLRK